MLIKNKKIGCYLSKFCYLDIRKQKISLLFYAILILLLELEIYTKEDKKARSYKS